MSSVKKSVSESEVVLLWQRQVQQERSLLDTEGEPVTVIYPGRPNDSRGGDFRDAVVASANANRQGCIEVHTKASGWEAHGHHRDPAYNQVVLHVAMEMDRPGQTLLQNGKSIPTVILKQPAAPEPGPAVLVRGLPCQRLSHRWSREKLALTLDRAGDLRLQEKAARFLNELANTGPDQVLYRGILEALGYIKNKEPFVRLAAQAPLKIVEEKIRKSREKDISETIQALLLGTAGLLPSQRRVICGDSYTEHLEQIWLGMPHQNSLSFREWELFKVRPANNPVRRIIAVSYLILRYLNSGWLVFFSDALRRASPERFQKELEAALEVKAEGYWAGHFDFGRPLPASPVLLGRERAAVIAINVILPFFLAWSRLIEEPVLYIKVREVYRHYPRLESNSIERHMLQQLSAESYRPDSASRQQGLIQIYQKLCTRGKCEKCDFSN
mgnify:CR=1 FL=1